MDQFQNRALHSDLMVRMKSAHVKEHYFEVFALAQAIFEDRLLEALRLSGGTRYGNYRPIRQLTNKMRVLRQRNVTDVVLATYFTNEMLDDIRDWKGLCDSLINNLVDADRSMALILRSAYHLSSKAVTLSVAISDAAKLLKKHRAMLLTHQRDSKSNTSKIIKKKSRSKTA